MTFRTAGLTVRVAMAAALLRAGVAGACPTPPGGPGTSQCTLGALGEQDCTSGGALDLDVAIPQGVKDTNTGHWVVKLKASRNYGWASGVNGGVNVCDAMVLFQLSDDRGSSNVTASLQGSASTALRNLRISKVEPVNTPNASGNQPLRYGSGAFCLWTTEDKNVAGYGPEVFRVTVEAFDPQGNVHKGQAFVDMTCVATPGQSDVMTSQQAFYQWDVNSSGAKTQLDADYCGHMNTECVADATLPATCGPADVCACTDISSPPDAGTPGTGTTPGTPATPGNVCVNGGDRILCGPPAPTPPGTVPGAVCISNAETVVCGPVSVCVSATGGTACGPATGPGSTPGAVCISNAETVVCGPVGGSGSGPGNSDGDVCVSNAETVVCGPVDSGSGGGSGGGCVSNAETVVCPSADNPGDVCVTSGGTTCGQVPVVAASSSPGGNASGNSTTPASDSTGAGATPKTGCAAFPGADLGMGLLALLGLGALRRRR